MSDGRMRAFGRHVLLITAIAISACAPTPTRLPKEVPTPSQAPPTVAPTLDPVEQQAANALRDFLTQLHFRHYAEAALLYGGSYDELQAMFSSGGGSIEPAELWQRICDGYFLQCLLPKDVNLESHTDTSIGFRVSFFNPDGSTFTLGPCCGASEADMPPRSEFSYEVTVSAGETLILGTPPYVP